MNGAFLEVRGLKKVFPRRRGLAALLRGEAPSVAAVDGVSFFIRRGETMGLVGESGCGKTTVGRMVLGLLPPTSGSVVVEGTEITGLPPADVRPLRRRMQMIFQDLDAGLDPRERVRAILAEALTAHRALDAGEVARRTEELLDQVKLKAGKLGCYPDELSGGEKRRVGIARVLAVGATFIVADEPTSALDVSIQAQVVNLLLDLQERLCLTCLFISHDLRIVERVSDKVAVMYLGRIVETGLPGDLARDPRHPYTRLLWSSLVERRAEEAPPAAPAGRRAGAGTRDVERPPGGCPFAPRCPVRAARGYPAICTDPASEPSLSDLGRGRRVACHFPLEPGEAKD